MLGVKTAVIIGLIGGLAACGQGNPTTGADAAIDAASRPKGRGALGAQCRGGGECQSGFCVPVEPDRSVCTSVCKRGGRDCLAGWFCDAPRDEEIEQDLCHCDSQQELCNGRDDDCNGQINIALAGMSACSVDAGVADAADAGAVDSPADTLPMDMATDTPSADSAVDVECVPSTRECDGKDNDCDGTVDWGLRVPTDYSQIQQAIEAAGDGETICIAAGSYDEDLFIDHKEITLRGVAGASGTTVNGTGTTAVLRLEQSSAVIQGLTLRGGAGHLGEGGGIYAEYGSPVFRDLVVTDNHIVSSGSRSAEGGGVYVFSTSALFDNVVVSKNTATSEDYARGGGINLSWGNPSLNNVIVADNEAVRVGGASFAGGIDLYGTATSVHTLTNVIVSGNRADYGAGIFTNQGGDHVLTNVTVVGNTAASYAGGMWISSSMSPVLDNVIVAGNLAGAGGGGIYARDATFSISNCDLYNNRPEDFVGLVDPIGSNGNISALPAFVSRAGSDSLLWDLHLRTGSACVDTGDIALTDPDATRSDMGAYGGPGAAGW